jgi:hypothetical protein
VPTRYRYDNIADVIVQRQRYGCHRPQIRVAVDRTLPASQEIRRRRLGGLHSAMGCNTAQMSLRYAHLAPDQRREAAAKLNEKQILALTLRLPWEGFAMDSAYPL